MGYALLFVFVLFLFFSRPNGGSLLGTDEPSTVQEGGDSIGFLPACGKNSQCTRPESDDATTVEVLASWYGPGFHGRIMANGKRYNQWGLSAAHKKLPLGTRIIVCNEGDVEKRCIELEITDRGPYWFDKKFRRERELDLSFEAARRLGIVDKGVAPLRMKVVQMGKTKG